MSGKILNFGSLNIDRVYSVPRIVTPGETISSTKQAEHLGGKGLNQSLALARAGRKVYHAGAIGEDGQMLEEALANAGVDVSLLNRLKGKSGHTVIQVDAAGQNSIILSPGTNFALTKEYVADVFKEFAEGDMLLIQNEVNELEYIINQAYERKMTIVFNPSPFEASILELPLEKISWFMLNEIEAMQITNMNVLDVELILDNLQTTFPQANFVLTLGAEGSLCYSNGQLYRQEIYETKVVDTTGAGDTFTGYFIATLLDKEGIEAALDRASRAAAITVSREGAAPSIPTKEELQSYK